jgi:hypothetical protein
VDRYADADLGFVDAAVIAIVERLGETSSPHWISANSASCDLGTSRP